MRESDRAAFGVLLKQVHDAYRRDLSPFLLDVWWSAMKSVELQAVRQAFDQHFLNPDTGQFLPMPADIVRMLGGTTKDSALIAWSSVERAIKHAGSWSTVVFDDPIIHRAIEDVGGWTALCATTLKEWPFVERRFCEFYRAHKLKGLDEYPRKLLGHTDLANIPSGFAEMEPVKIGDAKACERVLEGKAGKSALPEHIAKARIGAHGK